MLEEWINWALTGPLSIEPLSWTAVAACILSGGIIGIERQAQGKPIGVRTNIVVCLGTYIFVISGFTVAKDVADPTRVIGQIITGIGFLGAGVMMTRDGAVRGVTTAATIWMLAAIGIMIGTSSPFLGVKLAILCVVVLAGVNFCEVRLARRRTRKARKRRQQPAEEPADLQPLQNTDPAATEAPRPREQDAD